MENNGQGEQGSRREGVRLLRDPENVHAHKLKFLCTFAGIEASKPSKLRV